MKLSHAILEGAQKVTQGTESTIKVECNQVRCCAIGMALLTAGGYTLICNIYYEYNPIFNLYFTFPILSISDGITTLKDRIIYWNDKLVLPPHEIAMRVASIECKAERGETINLSDWD